MTKDKIEKEIETLKDLFSKVQPLTTQFGLDNYGTQVHQAMENALKAIRERTQDLTERLESIK